MRFALNETLDAYEAFLAHGLEDGDHPLAGEVMGAVKDVLDDLGYECVEVWTHHNNGYICELKTPDGRLIDLDAEAASRGIDLGWDCTGAQVRELLLALGLIGLVKALDELNQETITAVS